ncbi:hypothetical protein C0Q70_12170 [Pomacea canaliculata]|uniref:Uncharacterized protein n=2 Tax=Pomacea canaliculata TaxID=400727 RepID=A0A2T7P0R8_POMCA|nr:hypothetical protein C0Q70_12170 [Pomacea canaliculata]
MAYLWNHQQPQVISRGPQPPQDFSHASYWQHETPAPLLPHRAQPVMHSPQLPQYSAPHVQPQPYRRPVSPGVSTAPLEVEPLEAELLTTTAPRPPLPLPVRHPPPAYHVSSPYQRPPNPPATWKAGANYNAQQVPPPPPRVGTGPLRPGQPQPAHAPIGVHAHHVQSAPQTYVAQHVAPAMHSAQAMGPSPHSYSQQQPPAYSSHGGWGSYSPAASDTGSPHDIFSSRFNVQAFQHGYIQAFVTTLVPPTQSPGSGTWGAGEWGQVGFNMNAAVPATTLPQTTTTTPSHMIAVNPAGIQAGFYIGPNPKSLDPTKQNRPKPTTQIIETIHQGSAADLAGGFFGNTPPPPTTTTPPLPGRDGNHMAGWLGFNGDQPTEPPASKARNEVSNQGFQSFFPVPGVDAQNTNQVSTGTGQNSAGKTSSQTVQNALSTLLQNLKGNPQLLSSVLSQLGSQPVRK